MATARLHNCDMVIIVEVCCKTLLASNLLGALEDTPAEAAFGLVE